VTFTCLSLNEVNEGDNFTCVCKGEGGNPPANVTWYKDGVQIGETGKKNKTLKLISVNETSNGMYKCEARSYTNDSFVDKKSIKVVVRQLSKYASLLIEENLNFIDLRGLYNLDSLTKYACSVTI
jgi:hypothetical protein